jgi:glycosyltransferase involved in cell wall biosynthesis
LLDDVFRAGRRTMIRAVLVWGRGATLADAYSRDRVVFRLLAQAGVRLDLFSPRISALGDVEAMLRRHRGADLVWVPCFRQRDVAAASRFARRRGLPLVFDPLISAYDKQLNERRKFGADSRAARRLLRWERRLFARPDVVIADTAGHADYFHGVLGVPAERLVVLPVGADESLFAPRPPRDLGAGARPRVLFYGSFIQLHGVPTIVAALARYAGPPIACHFVGDGPLRAAAEAALRAGAGDRRQVEVSFEAWLPLDALPDRIADADIVLGIFGTTPKARRVVPNKVYQALAMGRPVITADTPAFDARFRRPAPAPIAFTEPGDAAALAAALERWATAPRLLAQRGAAAARLFAGTFAEARLGVNLLADLEAQGCGPFPVMALEAVA